jgi:signal transduction histidine kinase
MSPLELASDAREGSMSKDATTPALRLPAVLRSAREELIQRWTRRVLDDPHVPLADRLDRPKLVDHIPELLDELVEALDSRTPTQPATAEAVGRAVGTAGAARRHARLRFLNGYTLAEALRELSHFRAALLSVCFDAGVEIDPAERLLLHATIDETMWTGAVEMERASRAALEEREATRRDEIAFRDRFIGILGHDLRNPLASIMFSAATLLQDEGLPQSHAKALRRVSASASHMAHMIDDLLDLTRSRLGGEMSIEPRPVDLFAICRHAVEELEGVRPVAPIELDLTGGGEGVWDPHRLTQLVSNLVGNALDYSPAGSPVRVIVRGRGDEVDLEVNNRGPTIPAEVIPTLFDPYRQGPQDGRRVGARGLGLGLFIARQIAEAHGGEISAESTPERGTTFRVRLPRSAPAPSS